MNYITEPEKQIPVVKQCDVLVLGSGSGRSFCCNLCSQRRRKNGFSRAKRGCRRNCNSRSYEPLDWQYRRRIL